MCKLARNYHPDDIILWQWYFTLVNVCVVAHVAGLDPARPLVDRYGSAEFRLTRDDATTVQVIHTNAGFLGEAPQVGHVDFCVNGGRLQPSCAKEPRNIRNNNYCSSPNWRNYPLAQLRCRVTIFLYEIQTLLKYILYT